MAEEKKQKIIVCHGHNCEFVGKHILNRLESDLAKRPNKKMELEECNCRGLCSEGPIVITEKNRKTNIHKKMDPIKASKLL